MAKIPLRTYIRDIEALIERGNTDEAIAHCRHILKSFPKFLDAYRMFGKAYLESQRYKEAADVFKRALMAAPEDFVSHVGLSIINDEQKKLDDTIWHMERAFETQPSNAAVQSELQRLYGRRDGMEPHKIRLTRGALAHMYVQGELYPQAIGEIRSVLNEDPNRTDMQALLALAYFRNGQKVEATETCSQLLGRFPYCLTANRILVEILPGTGMADNVPTYRGRVVELDPYAAYSPGSIFQSDETPDNAITIDRFDFKGQPTGPQLEWKDGLALPAGTPPAATSQSEWLRDATPPQLGAPSSATSQPDWLRDAAPPQAGASVFAPTPPPAEAIPDFLRDAGWGASTGVFDESAQFVEEGAPASDGIEKADLPDWVKAMAPTSAPEPAPSASDDDWLNKLGSASPQTPVSAHAPVPGQTPDWLSSLGEPAGRPVVANAASDIPDWLTGMGESPAPAAQSSASDASDWLASLGQAESGSAPESQFSEPARLGASSWMGESEPAKVEPMRDSSKEPAKSEPPAPPPSAGLGPSIGDLGASVADQDAAMLWLESLAAKQGAKAEELITNPDERLEKPPAWVEQAKIVGEAQVAEAARAEQPAAPEEVAAPAWSMPEDTSAFGSATDQTSAWLRNLEAEEGKAPEPMWSGEIEVTPPATGSLAEPAVEADLPSWLRGLDQEQPARKPTTDELPSWLKEDEAKEEALPEPTRPTDWMPEMPKAAEPLAPLAPEPRVVEPPKALKPAPVAPAPAAFSSAEEVREKFAAPAPAPTTVRAEEPIPAPKPPKPAPRKKPELAAADRAKLKRTGMLPPLVDPALSNARDHMEHARIPDALQAYGALIRKGKFLEEVTFDLKEALYRFPVEVSIWQTLGDAYMRANRLQDALDAYTKAEELLR